VAPHPEPDDHDPFSLGDSDEEDKAKDINAEATERLKKQAEEKKNAEGESKEGGVGGLQAAGRSGSVGQKDEVAENLLKETK
jgi:hypothetical protein